MKKFISFLITLTLILSLYPVSLLGAKAPNNKITTTVTGFTPSTVESPTMHGKYLILNADGESYGGSLNDALYGKGAPLNGEYDVDNSDYYFNGDYYNMPSNNERKLFPKFMPYQQTMQDTSGIACIVMILNYLGYDVSKYSELYLLKEYERINETTVYGNGTTPAGLVALVNELGLKLNGNEVIANCTEIDTTSFTTDTKNDYDAIVALFRQCILDGKFLVMRYQSPNGYGYKVLLGHDNKGKVQYSVREYTSTHSIVEDDYFIFAEPNDNYDHFQDGFTANRSNNVIRWWFNMDVDGTVLNEHEYFIIDPSIDVEFNDDKADKETAIQDAYLNMYKYAVSLGDNEEDEEIKELLYTYPRNGQDMWQSSSGVVVETKKYGSSRDSGTYGNVSTGGGVTDRPDLPYAKINDFYNIDSNTTRTLLPNYAILQQTMGSSSGVCSVTSVLKYYGGYATTTHYDFELSYYSAYNNNDSFTDVVSGGTLNDCHKIVLKDLGYTAHYYQSRQGETPVFEDYYAFKSFVKYNLDNGRPIVTIISPSDGQHVTIIGYDDMGNDHIYDDVLITADSADDWDGYQDGYVVISANQFYRQFTQGFTSNLTKTLYDCLVIYKN